MSYLPPEQLTAVRVAALDAGLGDPAQRPFLFAGLRAYETTLPRHSAPGLQLQSDLGTMNEVARLVDGSIPLETWLRNAVGQTLVAAPRTVLEEALDVVSATAAGEPSLAATIDHVDVTEAIVFRDDMLPLSFLRSALDAAPAVARLAVPPHSSGQPMDAGAGGVPRPPHLGTAWLVAPTLLLTNHHVVNARSWSGGTRPAADEADLRAQAAAATASFTAPTGGEQSCACSGLEAWDEELDYAVLRLAESPQVQPLRTADEPLRFTVPGEVVAVNVIQHPEGGPQRFALRNNLVHRATDRTLQYFTDTRPGSSGSPVFTDDWLAVALHRGSRSVSGVSFQGKPTGVVNVGTQLAAVRDDLRRRFPSVHAEIAAV